MKHESETFLSYSICQNFQLQWACPAKKKKKRKNPSLLNLLLLWLLIMQLL